MNTSPEMKNLKTKKLYLQVYDEIRRFIKDNHLQPGDKLPTELEMCDILGVSRNVLREAIKSLEITGVLNSKPGVGITIREFNSDFFMSALISHGANCSDKQIKEYVEEMRRVLELGFAQKAFDSLSRTELAIMDEQLKIMQARADQMYNEETEDSQSLGIEFAKADALFHRTMFSRVDNVLLASIIDFFWAYDKYYRQKVAPEYVNITIDKHIRIMDALHAHNYEQFYAALVYHFTYQYDKK